jgi:hypothetical protein
MLILSKLQYTLIMRSTTILSVFCVMLVGLTTSQRVCRVSMTAFKQKCLDTDQKALKFNNCMMPVDKPKYNYYQCNGDTLEYCSEANKPCNPVGEDKRTATKKV